MPFHVEISRSLSRAWAFNLNEDELRASVLDPWLADVPIAFGGKEWQPGKSELRVLDGPRLEGPDLAIGQGWSNAARRSEDVTRRVLAESAAQVRVVAIAAGRGELEGLAGAGFELAPFDEARRLVAADPGSRVRFVCVVFAGVEPGAQFEAGVAAGTLTGRVLVAAPRGTAAPRGYGDLPVSRYEPNDFEEVAQALRRLIG